MVEVKVTHLHSNAVTIVCPLCQARVVRVRQAFISHMVSKHSATESTFDTVANVRRSFDSPVRLSNNHIKHPIMCYGCGSTFLDSDELGTHLMEEHNAV
jgi:hypothetical protein